MPGPGTSASTAAAPSEAPVDGNVVVVVGDLICNAAQEARAAGSEAQCKSEETAALAKSLSPDAVLLVGDIQYERGTRDEYAEGYERSSWASLESITHAAVGNHEYSSPGAAPYFAALGDAAGPDRRGYYRVRVGDWDVFALNSNCRPAGGCDPGSAQERWLRAELEASDAACSLAFFHHPRWTSGLHGSDASIEPLWAALADHDVEVALAGHDHHYERFAPERGVRQFVVGTGGRSLYPAFGAEKGTEVRNSQTFGVLELRLAAAAYSWKFHGIPGTTFTDTGRATCR